jgi:hypothetical protein
MLINLVATILTICATEELNRWILREMVPPRSRQSTYVWFTLGGNFACAWLIYAIWAY